MSSQTDSNEATDIENREPSRVGLTDLLGDCLFVSSPVVCSIDEVAAEFRLPVSCFQQSDDPFLSKAQKADAPLENPDK